MQAESSQSKSIIDLEEQIQKLNAIGIALSGEQNLKKLLELIVQEARGFTNADGGSLYIIENDRLNFVVAQTESLEKKNTRSQSFTSFYLPLTKDSIAGYVAVTGELLNIPDVYQIPPTVEYRINRQFDMRTGYRSKSMMVVPMRDHKSEIIGVLQLINSLNGYDQVVPFKPEFESIISSLASQAAVAIRNVKLIEEIKNLFRSLVRYSAKAIDARSPHTAGHSGRVAKYSVRMAQAINEETAGRLGNIKFTLEEIEELRMAGWLHDIGKIGVKENVLEKSNRLTGEQMYLIKERFESIKQGIKYRFLQRQLELVKNHANDLISMQILDSEMHQLLTKIDEEFEFIKQMSNCIILKNKELLRLENIAQKSYLNSQGERCKYLTQNEYEHLSIKRGNLTLIEYEEIQSHVEHTLNILDKIPFTKELQNIPKHAAAHHEYLDGTGYPNGLKGDEISYQARILCVADIFDALSSPDRPYKKAVTIEKSLNILQEDVKTGKLDGDIVELFIREKLYLPPPDEEDE